MHIKFHVGKEEFLQDITSVFLFMTNTGNDSSSIINAKKNRMKQCLYGNNGNDFGFGY